MCSVTVALLHVVDNLIQTTGLIVAIVIMTFLLLGALS